MQTTPIGLLFTTVFLLVSPAPADGRSPEQFDLICQGTDTFSSDGERVTTFTKRLRVDLTRKAFCDDNLCGNLVSTDRATLEYHCKAEPGLEYPCLPEPYSTGGPFNYFDDLVFDRTGSSFLRQVGGSVGDLNPHPFTETYLGSCTVSAFSGLTYSPDPGNNTRPFEK